VTAAPVPTNFATLDTATEGLMDATTDAINFLRSPPRANLLRSSNQTITTGTDTAIAFDAEAFDSHGGHDNAVNNSRYTAVYDGVYLVTYAVPWLTNTTNMKMAAWLLKSDGTAFAPCENDKDTSGITISLTGSSLMSLSTGDYVETWVWHNRGSSLAIDQTQHGGPRMSVLWVSAL
jgi:hypothetical protein